MRQLSSTFIQCLKSGFLSPITEQVKCDHDLSLDIREGYINIYYKGNSLLKLAEINSRIRYKAEIDKEFLKGVDISLDLTEETILSFVKAIPKIKQNISQQPRMSRELEYEQMIIRANNYEPRNNTEYFIVDRQYKIGNDRFDLTGIFWDRTGRKPNQEVPVCLMEIKFALNPDIGEVHKQIARYYQSICLDPAGIAMEMETIFRQKLELGLYHQSTNRLSAMKTLTFSRDIEDFQFILVLVDYNPNSSRLAMDKIRELPFSSQVKVFQTGFGMWQGNVVSVQPKKD
jgi:hypothetical protein